MHCLLWFLYTPTLEERVGDVVEVDAFAPALGVRHREKRLLPCRWVSNEHAPFVGLHGRDKVAFAGVDSAGSMRSKDAF